MNQTLPNKLFPLFVTARIPETRAFYTEKIGCELAYDMPDYLQLRFGGEGSPELCFMDPGNTPSLEMGAQEFPGHGVVVSIPAKDVDETHARLSEKGVPIVSKPTDRPWGWRSVVCRDPNGVLLDFFSPIAKPG